MSDDRLLFPALLLLLLRSLRYSPVLARAYSVMRGVQTNRAWAKIDV